MIEGLKRQGALSLKIYLESCKEEGVAPCKTGFLKGQLLVPEDFDAMGRDEIRTMFECPE